MRSTFGAIVALLATIASLMMVAGCGDSSTANDADAASPSAETSSSAAVEEPAPTPDVILTIDGPDDESSVHRDRVLVHGTVDPPNARVELNGHRAVVRDGEWRINTRNLSRGSNTLTVKGTAPDHNFASEELTILRKRSQAEIAAARQARALRKQKAEATFRASAQRIDYAQLIKNPERFDGKRVVYTGKIFQVREEGSSGGFLLMNVTCDEYDFCDDAIYVDFDHPIASAEDDSVTIYGTITGGYEYDTAAGGTNFVPRMHARYIDE